MYLREALNQWFRLREMDWSPRHAEQVRRILDRLSTSCGSVDVSAICAAELSEHYRKRAQKISASALNQERVYLNSFFKWATQMGYTTPSSEPMAAWRHRRVVVKRSYVELSREQEQRLLEASPPWLKRFILIALYTGLRTGTIRKLRPEMVRDGVLEVPASLMKTRDAFCLPVSTNLREKLAHHMLSLSDVGIVPSQSVLNKAFKAACARAGLPKETSPHDLRRTFVARLTECGVPLQTVMALGGWKSMGTILKHYASRATRTAAAAALECV